MEREAEAVAEQLIREHETGAPFVPFAERHGICDLSNAYDVQDIFVARMLARTSDRPAGYKVGLTSQRMQAMCKIDQPIAGVVLGKRVQRAPAQLSRADYGRLGIEFEIAVRLGKPLPHRSEAYSFAEVAAAVDAVCPALEVVDDRRCDYKTLDVLSLIADNSWNAGIVLGEFRSTWPDLALVSAEVASNGVTVDRGTGRDVLGHPFEPLRWLASHLAKRGNGLRAGDVVMTGSLVPTRFPAAGERFRYMLSGIGAIETEITA